MDDQRDHAEEAYVRAETEQEGEQELVARFASLWLGVPMERIRLREDDGVYVVSIDGGGAADVAAFPPLLDMEKLRARVSEMEAARAVLASPAQLAPRFMWVRGPEVNQPFCDAKIHKGQGITATYCVIIRLPEGGNCAYSACLECVEALAAIIGAPGAEEGRTW